MNLSIFNFNEGFGYWLTRLATFFMALAAGCVLIFNLNEVALRPYQSFSEREDFLKKLQLFEQNKDSYDAVFVGTSRTNRGLDISTFDSIVQKSQPDFKSFNLGLPALSTVEAEFILNFIKNLKPKKLKFVGIEPVADYKIQFENEMSLRSIYFHDFESTVSAVRGVLAFSGDTNLAFRHIKALFAHYLNFGALSDFYKISQEKRAGTFSIRNNSKIVENSGFLPMEDQMNEIQKNNRDEFLKNSKDELPLQISQKINRLKPRREAPELMSRLKISLNPSFEIIHEMGTKTISFAPIS